MHAHFQELGGEYCSTRNKISRACWWYSTLLLRWKSPPRLASRVLSTLLPFDFHLFVVISYVNIILKILYLMAGRLKLCETCNGILISFTSFREYLVHPRSPSGQRDLITMTKKQNKTKQLPVCIDVSRILGKVIIPSYMICTHLSFDSLSDSYCIQNSIQSFPLIRLYFHPTFIRCSTRLKLHSKFHPLLPTDETTFIHNSVCNWPG